MDHETTAAALASCLPAALLRQEGAGVYWSAREVADFQAERLAESGYTLIWRDDDQPDTDGGEKP